MVPTVYLETTVISYLTSRPSRDVLVAAHQAVTIEWWKNDLPKFKAVISPVVLDEISAGDPEAVTSRLATVENMPLIEITPEVTSLAVRYDDMIRLPESARADALHLALATWHGVDYLVSWNCRHIVSGRTRTLVQALNDSLGVATPVICTPEELLEFSND
jgi:hypothetical protein